MEQLLDPKRIVNITLPVPPGEYCTPHSAHVLDWKWKQYWERDITFIEPRQIYPTGCLHDTPDSFEPWYGVD